MVRHVLRGLCKKRGKIETGDVPGHVTTPRRTRLVLRAPPLVHTTSGAWAHCRNEGADVRRWRAPGRRLCGRIFEGNLLRGALLPVEVSADGAPSNLCAPTAPGSRRAATEETAAAAPRRDSAAPAACLVLRSVPLRLLSGWKTPGSQRAAAGSDDQGEPSRGSQNPLHRRMPDTRAPDASRESLLSVGAGCGVACRPGCSDDAASHYRLPQRRDLGTSAVPMSCG